MIIDGNPMFIVAHQDRQKERARVEKNDSLNNELISAQLQGQLLINMILMAHLKALE